MTRVSMRSRVARGAKWMREHYGKRWFKKVNAETLALQSSKSCILGQVHGGYSEALDDFPGLEKQAEDLGFVLKDEDDDWATSIGQDNKSNWTKLTQAWKAKIQSLWERE